jgi:molybdopterin molybdotransferase
MLTFDQARASVLQRVPVAAAPSELTHLDQSLNRVLAVPAKADRDLPPFDRSARDGFAVRSADLPGELRIIGEVQAGLFFSRSVGPGEAVEIMTGAPVPEGADCVVMIEHVRVEQQEGPPTVTIPIPVTAGQNISLRAAEAVAGDLLIPVGKRLSYSDVALLAATGHSQVSVYPRPRVAILPTGDELVPAGETPLAHQIRNSNAHSLAAQVTRAGGVPEVFDPVRDTEAATREAIRRGLESEMLLLSGGVSAGKYDIVERILAEFGSEFFFDRVAIQPGQPVVFGRALGKFFFGLPGNPNSTMVTFELFARAALERISGQAESTLPFSFGRLAQDFRHKPGLTRFLPAHLSETGDLMPILSKGSADIPALSRANVFLVADAERPEWHAGDMIRILPK